MDELYSERLAVLEDWRADIEGEQYALNQARRQLPDHERKQDMIQAIDQRLRVLKTRLTSIKKLISSVEKEGH